MSKSFLTANEKAVLQLIDQTEINARYSDFLKSPFFAFLVNNLTPQAVAILAAGWDEAEKENPQGDEIK